MRNMLPKLDAGASPASKSIGHITKMYGTYLDHPGQMYALSSCTESTRHFTRVLTLHVICIFVNIMQSTRRSAKNRTYHSITSGKTSLHNLRKISQTIEIVG